MAGRAHSPPGVTVYRGPQPMDMGIVVTMVHGGDHTAEEVNGAHSTGSFEEIWAALGTAFLFSGFSAREAGTVPRIVN